MSSTLPGIVFDLDQTLLDSSALADLRDRRDWGMVGQRLGEVVPFTPAAGSVAPESVPTALYDAGVPVGVLTRSPRWYAEQLIRRFGIRHTALITGSDGYLPKPDTAALVAIARSMGVEAREIVFVGDDAVDHEAASVLQAMAVGVNWAASPMPGWTRFWPDLAVADPDLLLDIGNDLAALGDLVLAGVRPRWHWGTLLCPAREVFCCGRYFQTTDIERHRGHPLTALTLRAKNEQAAAEEVGRLMAHAAEAEHWRRQPPTIVVSVPPDPEAEWDRFEPVRPLVAQAFGAIDGAGVLTMNNGVANYKAMPHGARAAANRGRFSASSQVSGQRVLVLDNVWTSGATSEACAQALREAGAGAVEVLALTLTQTPRAEMCPRCQVNRLCHKTSVHGPFISCTDWRGCGYKRNV